MSAARLLLACCFIAVITASLVADPAPYEPALYPDGLPSRHNDITEADERPEFVLVAEAAVPETNRRVIVYAERLTPEPDLDRLHWVHVALLGTDGDAVQVLDRREVTEEIELFVERPGHFLDLEALITPLPSSPIVAVELWVTLSGTGFYTEARHLFFRIDGGKLQPVLELDMTYASSRSDGVKNAALADIRTNKDASEIVVSRRDVVTPDEGDEEIAKPSCGPPSFSRYRFSEGQYRELDAPASMPSAGFTPLPRLPAIDLTCSEDG